MFETIAKFIQLNPFIGVFLMAFLVTLIITLVTKFTTNQAKIKEIKDKQKECQARMKECKNDAKKMMEIQKEMMVYSGELMRHSFKPMLITWLPIILIFTWANANIAYLPIHPGEEFSIYAYPSSDIAGNITLNVPEGITIIGDAEKTISQKMEWKLKGNEGVYNIIFYHYNQNISKKLIITKEIEYAPVKESYKKTFLKSVEIGNKKLKVIFGLNWLWSYILFSFILTLILRKIFNVQ